MSQSNSTLKRTFPALLALTVAGILTLLLSQYGAHDLAGVLTALVGFPGTLLIRSENTEIQNILLFALANWIAYLLLFEIIAFALRRRRASRP
jgi:hypothetical protein